MPSVEIEKPAAAAPGRAWAFISDMDSWAPLLTGYQSHRKIDDRHSRWTVRGELAGLSRVSEFDVTITDWVENVRIGFTLEGLDEPFSGSGAFHVASAETRAAPVGEGWFARLRAGLIRQVLLMMTGRRWHSGSEMAGPPAAAQSVLSCRLEILAGGGSGPIMNLLLGPILELVAKDTAARIVAALEAARDEFIDYYETKHVPLILRHVSQVADYRRSYVLPSETISLSEKSPQGAMPSFDVITEGRFRDRHVFDAMRASLTEPEAAARVAADEENFLDRGKMMAFLVDERRSGS